VRIRKELEEELVKSRKREEELERSRKRAESSR